MLNENKELKNTRFFANLTQNGAGIKETRTLLVAKQVIGELGGKIQTLNNELNQLELEIASHEDLSPNNEYSLEIATADFKASDWIDQYYALLDTKRLKEEELEVYLQIKDRQFGQDSNTKEDGD